MNDPSANARSGNASTPLDRRSVLLAGAGLAVYVRQDDAWKLASLSFTRTLGQ